SAASLAAARIDEAGIAALGRELDRMVAAESVEDLVDADMAFHSVIARAAGNSVLASLLESLSTRTLRTRIWRGRDEAGALEGTRSDHRRIYDAIRHRDPSLAHAMAAAHVANGEAWLAAHLEAGADWPEIAAATEA
ncbi:MAG: FCD domain-containing protein, partial [Candidatus Dormibacteraeota bacterium]|nr:FCD domain-containing protein [Candidatus Dormibacteraeota bacterium]